MLQNGSKFYSIDNSGAKIISCIKIVKGYKKRYGFVGDLALVSVKSLRSKKKEKSKIKKGSVSLALIVRTKSFKLLHNSDSFNFLENSAVLLTKQFKCLGTRIFGGLPRVLRYSKFLKLITISSGILY